MELRDILGAIAAGDADEDLSSVWKALESRRETVSKALFSRLNVGEEVTFAPQINKVGGRVGTIVKKNRTRVVVEIDGRQWTADPSLLVF